MQKANREAAILRQFNYVVPIIECWNSLPTFFRDASMLGKKKVKGNSYEFALITPVSEGYIIGWFSKAEGVPNMFIFVLNTTVAGNSVRVVCANYSHQLHEILDHLQRVVSWDRSDAWDTFNISEDLYEKCDAWLWTNYTQMCSIANQRYSSEIDEPAEMSGGHEEDEEAYEDKFEEKIPENEYLARMHELVKRKKKGLQIEPPDDDELEDAVDNSEPYRFPPGYPRVEPK